MKENAPAPLPPARFALLFTIAGVSALIAIAAIGALLSMAGVSLHGPAYLVMALLVMPLSTRFAVRLGGRGHAGKNVTPTAG